MLNNGSSSSGHVRWLCVHVEVCMQPSESAFMCVCAMQPGHMKTALMWVCCSRLDVPDRGAVPRTLRSSANAGTNVAI